MQGVALDLERRRDAMRLGEIDAVVVQIVGLRSVAPVRHLGDLPAQLGLADVHPASPAGQHVVGAVLAEQLGEFAEAIAVGVDLRLDVAPGDFRRAGIGANERLHVGIDLAAPQDLERRDQQALLKHVGGVAAVGARNLAAEVRLVGDIADEADDPFAHEHRRDHGHVGRVVLAGLVGVVDDEGVARLDRTAEAPADLVHLRRQRPDMQRLRDALRHHAALAVEDREGEVLALLDDGRIARAQHVERELAGDLQGGLVDDFEVDGVHRRVSPRLSCPLLSGHPVITACSFGSRRATSVVRCLLGRPVKPGDDSGVWVIGGAYFTGYVFSSCAKYPSCFSFSMMLRSR